jgi:hypothetical protein
MVILTVGGVGLIVMFMAAGSVEWGPPGTEAYDTYEMMNRLVTIPSVLLVVGVFGTGFQARSHLGAFGWVSWLFGLAGSLLVLVGNVAEFWIYTSRSYSDEARNLAWGSFVLGGALLLVAGILAAVRAGRSQSTTELNRT